MSAAAIGAERRPRLRELDALRGIAAAAVVLFHYSVRFHELFPAAPHAPVAFRIGHYSVLLFFAISGFVIAMSLDRARTAADFLVHRAGRLYPAYWVALALTLALERLTGTDALAVPNGVAIANLTMLHGFAYLPGVDGVYWTLTVELAFYATTLLIWRLGLARRLEWVIALWLLLHVVAMRWDVVPGRVQLLLVLRYIPYFAIGMAAFRIWNGERGWRRQAPVAALIVLTLALGDAPDMAVAGALLIALFAALLKGWLRFLCVPPLLHLGAISYCLYLLHHNIGFVVMLRSAAGGIAPWPAMAIAIAVALLLAAAVHHLVEYPAERALRGWWRRRSAARVPGVAPA